LNTTQALEKLEATGIQSSHVRALVDFIKTSERGVVK
jgi:Udp N-acetylglucosamine O-acyltransferase